MFTLNDITVIICNWMQTRMTLGAVRNMCKHYNGIKIIVVDDGSTTNQIDDFNIAYARPTYSRLERFDNNNELLETELEKTNAIIVKNSFHSGHGSALDYGFDKAITSLVLTMDNDIRMVEKGLVEEYIEKMNKDPENIYAVGTTYVERNVVNNTGWYGKWIDPWFTLYQREPIKKSHLTFSDFSFPYPEHSCFHIGTGAFLHTMLTEPSLHRPKIWKAIYYPEPELIPQLVHLKKSPEDPLNSPNVTNWNKYIDG